MNIGIVENCFGCSACFNVCPTKAILMCENKDGFIYPRIIDKTCVDCGACTRVCPSLDNAHHNTSDKYYSGFNRDYTVWKSSTSGGAFRAICELFGDENTYFVGACFDSLSKRVEHRIVKGVSNTAIFSGSKYVQSYMGDVFSSIRMLLVEGNSVVFSGTPCQVAGLSRYLENTNTSNLLTVSLICNGVGSPKVFRAYLEYFENKYKANITDYRFRDKRIVFGVHHLYRRTVEFNNGRSKSSNRDKYNNCYVMKILCRESCFHCQYNDMTVEGDITLGDFKKQYIIVKNAPYNRNGSFIISHTVKGESICKRLMTKMIMYEVGASSYDYPSHGNYNEELRNDFFREFTKDNSDVYCLLDKYDNKSSIKSFLCGLIPDKVKGYIKRKNR